MSSPIRQPSKNDYIIADENAEWLNTPSPFNSLDEEWYHLIVFFVFHVPVSDLSARSKSLTDFGWGNKSRTGDFKKLKNRFVKYGSMDEGRFVCEDGWAQLKNAVQNNDLMIFPNNIIRERVSYRKTKTTEIDSLLAHIRNSFAHGRLAFYNINNEVYIAMEDIDNKKYVSARMILSKKTLLRWKAIIEQGPFAESKELEQIIGWNKN